MSTHPSQYPRSPLIVEGGSAADALQIRSTSPNICRTAGYQRYWVAEHHNMDGVASSATSVLIGYLAAGTKINPRRLRRRDVAKPCAAGDRRAVRHARHAVPGRIDLGLGRAPGTDQMTMRALPHAGNTERDDFIGDVVEARRNTSKYRPMNAARCAPSPASDVTCQSGCSAPVSTAHRWQRIWLSVRVRVPLYPAMQCRRCGSIAHASARTASPARSPNRMRWWPSTSSAQTPTTMRRISLHVPATAIPRHANRQARPVATPSRLPK